MGEVTVYATSDLHAHWLDPAAEGEVPGAAAAVLGGRGIRNVLRVLAQRDRASSILVDNGDLLTGSGLGAMLADTMFADAALAKGPHPVLAALETSGFDAWVPGNHDFDHGIAWLRAAIAGLTTLTTLCANCVDAETGEQLFPASKVVERGGLTVGIIGAVTGQVQRLGRYEGVREVRFTDPIAAVSSEAQRLRAECDIIVVAYHGGFVRDPQSAAPMHYDTGEDQGSRILALPDVDGLIAGHQHWARAGVAHRGDAERPIGYVQPGYAGEWIGELRYSSEADVRGARLLSVATECAVLELATAGLAITEPVTAESATAESAARPEATPSGTTPPEFAVLDELAGGLAAWLDAPSELDAAAIHTVVAARMGGPTALALPTPPGSLRELRAAFPGVYGVSRVRLPENEYRAALAAARAAGLVVTERGTQAAAHTGDVCAVVNAPLRAFMPEGRVHEDSVVDWLDEIVYARRRGALAHDVAEKEQ